MDFLSLLPRSQHLATPTQPSHSPDRRLCKIWEVDSSWDINDWWSPLMSLPFPSLPSTVCSQALSHLSHPYLPPMWVGNTSFIDKNDPIASQTISPGSRRDGSRLTQCGLHGNKANWLIPRDWTSDTGSNVRVSLRLSQPQHPLSPTPQAPPRSSNLGPTLPAVLWQRGWVGET